MTSIFNRCSASSRLSTICVSATFEAGRCCGASELIAICNGFDGTGTTTFPSRSKKSSSISSAGTRSTDASFGTSSKYASGVSCQTPVVPGNSAARAPAFGSAKAIDFTSKKSFNAIRNASSNRSRYSGFSMIDLPDAVRRTSFITYLPKPPLSRATSAVWIRLTKTPKLPDVAIRSLPSSRASSRISFSSES